MLSVFLLVFSLYIALSLFVANFDMDLYYNELYFMLRHTEILEIDYYMQFDNYGLVA